jgi:hypothetical protein
MKVRPRRAVAFFLAAWFVLCLAGEGWDLAHPPEFTPTTSPPVEPTVQLRCATLPSVLRAVAVHHWWVAYDPADGRWHRWEVWQNPNAGGTSWGHVHRDLMGPDGDVGGGSCQVLHETSASPVPACRRRAPASSSKPRCSVARWG